ncbi:MAG TPA: type II toxin-antitoxin system prevent-host-death family antitoxin [Bryobacteraceae bacterium]|jgi:prevent-host-death family protein|nr:type II toxin-antitoxin system prevent-host-death family antitoxin [Bryobacteraceae bacterium]
METVSALDARTHMGKLLDRVARDEEIVITRHDKPVARIVPEGRSTTESLRETVTALRMLRAKAAHRTTARPISDAEIRSAISQCRK